MGGYGWYGDHMNGWGWVAASVTMLLVTALLVLGAIAVARQFRPGPGSGIAPTDAEQVLAERYARGEIDDEEYARRLANLRSHPAGPPSRA